MKIVIGLGNTITVLGDGVSYEDLLSKRDVVAKLRERSAEGFSIVIHTLRKMRTSAGRQTTYTQSITDKLLLGEPPALDVLEARR